MEDKKKKNTIRMHGTEMEVILLGTIEPTSNLRLPVASEDVINLSVSVSLEPESGLRSSHLTASSQLNSVFQCTFVSQSPRHDGGASRLDSAPLMDMIKKRDFRGRDDGRAVISAAQDISS